MKDLQTLFESNARALESVELDILDWDSTDLSGAARRSFSNAWTMIRMEEDTPLSFPALTRLSLSNVAFEKISVPKLAMALNAKMLRSLTIRNCRHAAIFLSSLSRMEGGVNLEAFELCMDDTLSLDPAERPIYTFLASFSNLKTLCLLVHISVHDMGSYSRAISNHSNSLERLVWHGRHGDRNADFRTIHNCPEFGRSLFGDPAAIARKLGPASTLLSKSPLEFLGVCIEPIQLVSLPV